MKQKPRKVHEALIHRVFKGIKDLPAKELSAFIIQNASEGFARGLAKEMKNG